MELLKGIDFVRVESAIWVANRRINVPAYDFQFAPLFRLDRPRLNEEVSVVSRIGAISDYPLLYQTFLDFGFRLINSPEQHDLAGELEHWYPLIKELTPTSKVYEQFPSLEELKEDFEFPIFIKGNRQTSRHNADLSIARSEEDFRRIAIAYAEDDILHWQKIVVREFIPLHPLDIEVAGKVPISLEIRTFWWKGQFVNAGRYWSQYLEYTLTSEQFSAALEVAQEASDRLDVPFLVIDLALTQNGNWIVIECNDGQESGYCGGQPHVLWSRIVDLEKGGGFL